MSYLCLTHFSGMFRSISRVWRSRSVRYVPPATPKMCASPDFSSASPDSYLLLLTQIKLELSQKALLRIGSVAVMLPVLIVLIGLELSVGNCMRHHDGGMPLVHVLWSIAVAMHQILFMSITKTMLSVFDCGGDIDEDTGTVIPGTYVMEKGMHICDKILASWWSDKPVCNRRTVYRV